MRPWTPGQLRLAIVPAEGARLTAHRCLDRLQDDVANPGLRIASLLPSATEIVYALGLGDSLVAVTHECDFPLQAASKPAVTSNLLPPDLSPEEIDRAVRESQRDAHSIYALQLVKPVESPLS